MSNMSLSTCLAFTALFMLNFLVSIVVQGSTHMHACEFTYMQAWCVVTHQLLLFSSLSLKSRVRLPWIPVINYLMCHTFYTHIAKCFGEHFHQVGKIMVMNVLFVGDSRFIIQFM